MLIPVARPTPQTRAIVKEKMRPARVRLKIFRREVFSG
jgi:hypothetical protein